ncbi:MAG: hypothetical protein J2P21_12105 [Chloracidobacterium sp.]|nr:hypothetical protein [Chloracidobacterium sp.]
MSRRTLWSVSSTMIVLGLTLTLIRPALAGPVLICKSYDIGAAKSLPWGGSDWRAVKTDYDIDRLVDDTLALLTPETPVITRMETLRRAVIYAVWSRVDREVNYRKRNDNAALELFSRLVGDGKRSAAESANRKPDPLRLFDAGFFVESWKQAYVDGSGKKPVDFDGYALVKQAIALRGNDPEMEFAAALITSVRSDKAAHRAHLQKAIAGAPEGSLLARNIVNHFGRKGQSIADLRASLAKN